MAVMKILYLRTLAVMKKMDDALSELEPDPRKTRHPVRRWLGFVTLGRMCLHNGVDKAIITILPQSTAL